MYAPGPAISSRTSAWLLPQKEQMVKMMGACHDVRGVGKLGHGNTAARQALYPCVEQVFFSLICSASGCNRPQFVDPVRMFVWSKLSAARVGGCLGGTLQRRSWHELGHHRSARTQDHPRGACSAEKKKSAALAIQKDWGGSVREVKQQNLGRHGT